MSIILMAIFQCAAAEAQQFQNRGWFYLSHTNKITGPLSFFGELQLRSEDRFDYLNTTLVRTGLTFDLKKDKQIIGLGYTYKGDKEMPEGADVFEYTREHRIYEEYIFRTQTGNSEFQLRGRLEQRFVTQSGDVEVFSQRVRLLASFEIPWKKVAEFEKGIFSILQDEVMGSVQNAGKMGGSFFDQNRLYGSVGYRFSKEVAVEAGYYYWLQAGQEGTEHKNVYQVKITTDL